MALQWGTAGVAERAVRRPEHAHDERGNGKVGVGRLGEVLRLIDPTATAQDASELEQVLDRNAEGVVTRHGFKKAGLHWLLTKEREEQRAARRSSSVTVEPDSPLVLAADTSQGGVDLL